MSTMASVIKLVGRNAQRPRASAHTLGLEAIDFSTDELVLATAKNHRFARRKKIAFAETLDEDAVGTQYGSTLQTFLAQVVGSVGKPLKLHIQLSSFDLMCRTIGGGVGVAIVPERAAQAIESA